MRSYAESKARWEATFTHSSSLSDLKAFLLFENLDRSTWSKTLSDSRGAYMSLREHFLKNIEHPDDLAAADPLADDEKSPWNTLRQDEALRAEIFQDVERCMPDNLYFREPSTQTMLLDILFIFCKLNQDVGYRQGMHEVLAPILWVLSRDATDIENHNTREDDLMRESLDANYLEHDAFTLFGSVMQTVKSFYELGKPDPPTTVIPPGSTQQSNSPIVLRSKRIHEEYLAKADPELGQHLTDIDVLPQIFLIRWIRLLFGREFPFEDVLALWDILFAEDPALELVDFICVAMLLRIRWQLMDADYSTALTLLLRYPVPEYPHGPPSFVGDALYLRKNLQLDGGTHIVSKYSGKAPHAQSEKQLKPKQAERMRFRKMRDGSPASRDSPERHSSPFGSPARLLQRQGGIEAVIQEAAKGVYSRGERWGVNKAIRGAVQGLQSGNSSPGRQPEAPRWSLDDGKTVASPAQITARIQALEERNKGLAKMLGKAMEELSIQQKEFAKQKADAAAEALGLAIAKVQFVQVYLEDPTISLPNESSDVSATDEPQPSAAQALIIRAKSTKPLEPSASSPKAIRALISHSGQDAAMDSTEPGPNITVVPIPTPAPPPTSSPKPDTNPKAQPRTPVPDRLQSKVPNDRPRPSPFHHPRPSLAQSSFSWMLGEDQRKSSFVSASPFPSEKRRQNAGRGELFGEEKNNGKGPYVTKGKKAAEGGDDDEGFTLGTLRGAKGCN
ncbi:Rab-GTPase-TBC domain [Lasallia pustulata]|uniref:Rab-GTPase-TBC domain n=1 Tax=Lasallia pustulata TaxID=136370 RepID=A0A1W5CXI8_9LECA|nr:Rab-GTPase-TBC domain [Lasallia pustulata]